jgi:hypothetical protein
MTVSQLQQKAQILQTINQERECLALELAAEIEELTKLRELSVRLARWEPKQILHQVLLAVAKTS